MGLEDVTPGEVTIDEQIVKLSPPSKRGMAMVFQTYALFQHLNLRGTMCMALKKGKRPKSVIKERAERASRMLNLEPRIDRNPSRISGGRRQRVAIGRAIVREPKHCLFDDPLSDLDAALRMSTRYRQPAPATRHIDDLRCA